MKKWKKAAESALMMLPLLLALLCVMSASLGSHQSAPPIPMPQTFTGEYSYDRETWLPLTENASLSALKGDLYLRGHFEMPFFSGQTFKFYRNHIGVSLYVNGERLLCDSVTEIMERGSGPFASMCGQEWYEFDCPDISPEDEIEIRLINPHRVGNESAYRDFLTTLCGDISGRNILARQLEPYGAPLRIAGGLFAVVSLMILGASVAAAAARIPVSGRLVKQGLITLFTGGFFLFDTIDVSMWNDLVALNTYGKQLCIMLAVLFAGYFVCDSLTGKKQTAARAALLASALLDSFLIAAALTGLIPIYDTLPYWLISEWILCPLLCVLCTIELIHAPGERRLVPFTGLLLFAAVLLDLFGVGGSIVLRSPCSKLMFIALFFVHLLDAARSIIQNQRASIRAETLEKELEDSRIAIMLSQIQPHFLYNVLGTIRGLCRVDPMQARQALDDFSDYLRGNMNALTNSNTIPFARELRHIEAYLRLEKMRMGPKLHILYDIQEKDFSLPPLSIQPLVENAVKHGLFEKDEGTLILHTRKEGGRIIIRVQDNGIGFDESAPLAPDDRHAHVGLANVRSRLEKISGGELIIRSAPGRGTIAEVHLQADFNENGGRISNEHTGN